MWKVCAICGQGSESKYPSTLYCSKNCRAIAKKQYREDHKEEWKEQRRLTMEAKCPICGKTFYKSEKQKKYCSPECRKEGDRRLWRVYSAEKRKRQKESKAYLEAMHSGKALDADEMAKVLEHYALTEDVPPTKFNNADRAVNKSVRMRRKQNMLLLQQDIIEADRLGISYGQYQAMKGK